MKGKKISSKRIKRIIIISLLIIIYTISKVNVNATSLTRDQIDGIYAVAPLSDRTHLYNLEIFKLGTSTAYCIEIGKPVSTTYTGTMDMNVAARKTNLSLEQINYLSLITHYGYGYKKHKDYQYYMAAQELIWEYINNIDITWTNELDVNGPKINIETYKNEIKSYINKYRSGPSFPDEINCKIGDTLTLTDNNNSLDIYTIANQGRETVSTDNNKILTINVTNDYIGRDTIELKTGKNYNGGAIFYYADTYQSLLTAGSIDIKTKTISLNISGETLTTNLVDKDNKSCTPSGQATLIGAEYEVYDKDNNLITTFTTNETCNNTIPNLYYDTYYIKQTKASTGYKLNDKIIEVNLTKNNTNITLEEEVIKSNIEINKLYELDDNYQKEEDITFNIYDYNNNLYKSITTTKEKDIVTLPYGTYTIKQMNTSYGYDMVKDISVTINENSNPKIKYDLVDKQIKSNLHITTKDSNTKEKIKEKNIKYKVKNKKTNKYISIINQDNKKITTFTTNEQGELTLPTPLPYGEYIIEQISTPEKYLKNTEKIKITIDENSTYSYIDNNVVINVDYYNEPIVGKINILTNVETISKNEDNTNTRKEDIRPNIGIELYKDNDLVNTFITNEEGKISIENLSLGNYCIKEKNNNNKKCLTLINIDNETPIIEKNITLTETIKLSNVILTNIDNLNNPIDESTIILYQDNKIINESITNNDGQIKINNLSEGNYCFQQIKVSEKYYLNDKKICFNIKNDGKDIDLKLINNIIPTEKISVPNTLSNINKSYFFLSIIPIIVGVVIYKKKNNNLNY